MMSPAAKKEGGSHDMDIPRGLENRDLNCDDAKLLAFLKRMQFPNDTICDLSSSVVNRLPTKNNRSNEYLKDKAVPTC